jgi:hypothetical protein
MKYSEALTRGHPYYCIECKNLIASSRVSLKVDFTCSNCEDKHTIQALARQNEKISVDQEYRKEKAEKRKQYLKKRKEEKNAKNINQ